MRLFSSSLIFIFVINELDCVEDLDLGGVATSYGLLKMPRMPELTKLQLENFTADPIDVNTIKYKGIYKIKCVPEKSL